MADSPKTIGDLIKSVQTDDQTINADRQALTDAQNKLTADLETQVRNEKSLSEAVKTTGGVFVVNEDGSATAYEPDGAGGFKETILKPASTSLDGSSPTPTPAPEPSPTPEPAPEPMPDPVPSPAPTPKPDVDAEASSNPLPIPGV